MCGINLCFGEDNINWMNSAIGHRGIRSNTKHLKNDLYLGHVRLPIQGLSTDDDHPKTYGHFTGAFVGEIYNYKSFHGNATSDLQVLLQQLDLFGPDCFKNFDGMWSAIVYDNSRGLVHIFTDPLTKKPLYMRKKPFAISSEIKALTLLGENTFDPIYFASVAKWGYCPECRTPFKEISKIPEGIQISYHIVKKEIISIKTYIDIKPDPGLSLIGSLRRAVENRTVSDVPVALLMSGGLDSAIIYYLLKQFKEDITIFHVDNDEAQYLEYIDFRKTDKLVKIDIDDDYNLEEILIINEGPVDLGSLIPQTLLAKRIKEHGFNVCISGDGADELFGGYKRSMEYDSQYSDIFHELVYYHLPRLDKTMMAHTIELRCPFLAPNVISKALSIPYVNRRNKYLLKETFRGVVPNEIIDREKKPLRYRTDRLGRHKLISSYKNLMEEIEVV